MNRLAGALFLCAILCAQVFGMRTGWVCWCSGSAMRTAVDHCHAPHGPGCAHGAPYDHDHQDSDDDGEAPCEHSALIETPETLLPGAASLPPCSWQTMAPTQASPALLPPDLPAGSSDWRRWQNVGPPLILIHLRTVTLLI